MYLQMVEIVNFTLHAFYHIEHLKLGNMEGCRTERTGEKGKPHQVSCSAKTYPGYTQLCAATSAQSQGQNSPCRGVITHKSLLQKSQICLKRKEVYLTATQGQMMSLERDRQARSQKDIGLHYLYYILAAFAGALCSLEITNFRVSILFQTQ